MKRWINGSAIILTVFALMGCSTSTTDAGKDPAASTIVFADGPAVAKMMGTGVYANAVSGEGTGAITYSSGTPGTASVDAATGDVTLVAAGTTVITAVKAATDTHSAVTATYVLTVTGIGSAYCGGKIGYILQSGDPGYSAGIPTVSSLPTPIRVQAAHG